MADLLDPSGDTRTDGTDVSKPPDGAQYIPTWALDQERQQDEADQWAQDQRGVLADKWEQVWGNSLANAWTAFRASPGSQIPMLTIEPDSGPAPAQYPDESTVNTPVPEAPQANGTDLIHTIFDRLGGLANQLAGSGAANVAGKLLGAGEGPAPGLPPEIHPEDTGLTQEQVAQAAEGTPGENLVAHYPELEKAGQAIANAGLMAPGIAGQVAEGVGLAKGAISDARLAQGLGRIDISMAGAAEDAFDASHPLIQKAAEVTGENPQKLADVLSDPSQLGRIVRTRNAARDLTPTQQVARTVYRASKDAQVAEAAASDTGEAAQAVVQAAPVHNPDPQLMDLLQQSIDQAKAAKGEVPPVQPLLPEQQELLTAVGELPPAPADAVVRDAARTALGEGVPTYEPDFRGRMQEVQPARPMPPGEPPAATPDAAFEPTAGSAGRLTSGGGQPPQGIDYGLKPGQTPGGAPPPSGPSAAASFARGSLPGLLSGSAAAGTVWTQDQDDALWRRALLTALAFKAGSAIPYGVLGGERATMGSRFFQGFANNLLGPNVAGLKGLTDIGSLVTDPAFNFVRSMVRGNGLQSSASEGLAYYGSLLHGNGIRDGLAAAAEALNPLVAATGKTGQVAGKASLSEAASTNNLRTINGMLKFWEPIMARAEQAGMNATSAAATGVERTHPQFIPGDVGRVTDTAMQRAHAGMMMGEPEGVVGRMLLPVFKGIQQMGSAGKFVEPFANIPANLIDRGVSSTPLIGLLNGIGAKSPDAVIARQVLGATTAMLTRGLFQTTGAGPSDPNLRSAWLKAGNQPYSVKLPWSDTWVPINKIPLLPLRGALTFDAAVNDVKLNNGDGNVAAKFARSYGRALADDAFLPQLIQMGVALQKGDDSGVPSTVAGTVRMLLPMESRLMAKAESTVKPDVSGKPYRPAGAGLAEKVGSAVQAQVLANTPRGLGQPAPQPALTNTGQTEPNVQNGLSVLSPLAPTRPSYDPVQEAFGRIGVPLSTPPTSITSNSKTIQLTGAEQQQYLRVRGQFLAENVPDGGFDSVEQAQRLLQKADEHAAKEVKPTGDEFDQRAVSTKDARQQQAQQRSDAWSQALGVPLAAASARPTPTAPSASRAAAGAVSDAWAKALGK